MSTQEVFRTGCCEPFDPAPWQEKEITWKEKMFLKDKVKAIMHVPVNMGKVMTKNMERIEKAQAKSAVPLMLMDEESAWSEDLYIDVTKPVPDAEMAAISGTFLTRVFEGPFQNAGKWSEEMADYVKGKGKNLKKMYFSYTTCPNCAKAYGKNYVVLFAQVD